MVNISTTNVRHTRKTQPTLFLQNILLGIGLHSFFLSVKKIYVKYALPRERQKNIQKKLLQTSS